MSEEIQNELELISSKNSENLKKNNSFVSENIIIFNNFESELEYIENNQKNLVNLDELINENLNK